MDLRIYMQSSAIKIIDCNNLSRPHGTENLFHSVRNELHFEKCLKNSAFRYCRSTYQSVPNNAIT